MINLHISYLPYNRGAHPNFWSWVKNAKNIHFISEKKLMQEMPGFQKIEFFK